MATEIGVIKFQDPIDPLTTLINDNRMCTLSGNVYQVYDIQSEKVIFSIEIKEYHRLIHAEDGIAVLGVYLGKKRYQIDHITFGTQNVMSVLTLGIVYIPEYDGRTIVTRVHRDLMVCSLVSPDEVMIRSMMNGNVISSIKVPDGYYWRGIVFEGIRPYLHIEDEEYSTTIGILEPSGNIRNTGIEGSLGITNKGPIILKQPRELIVGQESIFLDDSVQQMIQFGQSYIVGLTSDTEAIVYRLE